MENAAARAVEACIYYSHTRPDKSKFDTAITVERYSSAENLAKAVFQGQYGNDCRGGGRKMDGFGEP